MSHSEIRYLYADVYRCIFIDAVTIVREESVLVGLASADWGAVERR